MTTHFPIPYQIYLMQFSIFQHAMGLCYLAYSGVSISNSWSKHWMTLEFLDFGCIQFLYILEAENRSYAWYGIVIQKPCIWCWGKYQQICTNDVAEKRQFSGLASGSAVFSTVHEKVGWTARSFIVLPVERRGSRCTTDLGGMSYSSMLPKEHETSPRLPMQLYLTFSFESIHNSKLWISKVAKTSFSDTISFSLPVDKPKQTGSSM